MEADQRQFGDQNFENTLSYSDPMVIGAAAFFFGYVIGSGKWNWFGREAGKIAASLGSLALTYVTQSFQEHNPQFFQENKQQMTH